MPEVIDTYYELVATFDQYPGNFQREVTEWVFGATDYPVDRGYTENRPHSKALDWAFNDDGAECLMRFFSWDEYGIVPSATLNSQSLEFRFEAWEEITPSMWNALKWAFESFTGRYESTNPPKLTKLEMSKVVTTKELDRKYG